MGKINVLGFDVANLIAAGEVVDRPASVVKELLENAIDAGGTVVTIEIRRGGVASIRVTDNGCGMDADDLPVSILRHATSKIKAASDLSGISTLGFRGEALAAISSVSKMKIFSKTADSKMGALLESAGGEITSFTEVGCPEGTSVIVDDLFFNVPARRKFLKKDSTEAAAVSAVVEKIALSRADVSIKYISDGEVKFMTAGHGNLSETMWALFGRDVAKRLLKVDRAENGIHITGYISESDMFRSNRNMENFFINGRYVKSKTASAAVEQAFLSKIPHDKFPMCVINIEVNPELVDVNVHPSKLEVKFANEKLIFDAVYYAALSALDASAKRPELSIKTGGMYSATSDSLPGKKKQISRELRNAFVPLDAPCKKEDQLTLTEAMRETALDVNTASTQKRCENPQIATQNYKSHGYSEYIHRAENRASTGARAKSSPDIVPSYTEDQSYTEMIKLHRDAFDKIAESEYEFASELSHSENNSKEEHGNISDISVEKTGGTQFCSLEHDNRYKAFDTSGGGYSASTSGESERYPATDDGNVTGKNPKSNDTAIDTVYSTIKDESAGNHESSGSPSDRTNPRISAGTDDALRVNNTADVSFTNEAFPDPHSSDEYSYPDDIKPSDIPDYFIIGEAFNCYVIVQLSDRLLVIDKHAAHERIIFDELCRKMRHALLDGRAAEGQILLTPLEADMMTVETDAAAEHIDKIRALGFECEFHETGISTSRAVITQIPSDLESSEALELFTSLASRLSDVTGSVESVAEGFFESRLWQASCKAAIKGGRVYDIAHIKWICDRLLKKPGADNQVIRTCPHGRPVAFEIKKSSIDRQFARLM